MAEPLLDLGEGEADPAEAGDGVGSDGRDRTRKESVKAPGSRVNNASMPFRTGRERGSP